MAFPALEGLSFLRHCFLLRHPEIDTATEREEAIARLAPWHLREIQALGFDKSQWHTAEQVHGADVADVSGVAQGGAPVPAVDALICNQPGKLLGIYVADCCAVWIADEAAGSFGLVHSGKKGTELGIVPAAISAMVERHGADPARIVVQLSPCIRPPRYEVDFAAQIIADAVAAGVPRPQVHDTGFCTGADLRRFYSYRIERGRTGRMLALAGRPAEDTAAKCSGGG
jgi:copper oxidase (laccase) domain-containing protein